ncbi:hypothetical protein DL546_000679 [Coniochaeta pulveracea]|uniref:Uncharacterized protein n=1 Tax=Coniochaeta pulveracea TaxID=177199 RepID=A0A420XZ26_9PEZI|nr:hypothetical protein DL546_000679 [Coniochaeta pulveracea]
MSYYGNKEGNLNQAQVLRLNQLFDAFDAVLEVPYHGLHCIYVKSSIAKDRKSSLNGWARRSTDVHGKGNDGLEYDYSVHEEKMKQGDNTHQILTDYMDHLDKPSRFEIDLVHSMTFLFKHVISFTE